MPARVSTSERTYKGRTIASIVRTQFGPKAVFTAAEEGNGGTVTVDGAPVATITYATEWKREKPLSRQRRWENACSKLRDAIQEAQDVYDEYENAEVNEDGEYEDFDKDDAEQRASDATGLWSDGISELEELQGEYQDWYDNLPEALQYDSPVADKLQEVTGLYFEYVEFSYDEDPTTYAEGYVDEYEYVDLPLGWGRD